VVANQSGKPKLKNRCLVKNRTIALMNVFYSRPLLGLEIDDALALLYFEAAVNNGHVRAQYELGLSYEDSATCVDLSHSGILVRLGGYTETNADELADGTDASLALSYCTQAANKGYQIAQLRLGLAYLGGGLGLERCPDLETADMWFARASKVP
jgi:TPR repeat protein